jgi:hypothetical protein
LAGPHAGQMGNTTQPTIIVGAGTCPRVHQSTLQVGWSWGCLVEGPLVTAQSGVTAYSVSGTKHRGSGHYHPNILHALGPHMLHSACMGVVWFLEWLAPFQAPRCTAGPMRPAGMTPGRPPCRPDGQYNPTNHHCRCWDMS